MASKSSIAPTTDANGELQPCQSCSRPTPAAELAEHRSVCRYCHHAFFISHKRHLDTSHAPLETPAEHHDKNTAEFDASGIVETCELDFDQIDRDLGFVKSSPRDVRACAAELFKKVLLYCWPQRSMVRPALVRFAAACAVIDPALFGNRSFKEIGVELKVGKASISAASLRFSDSVGLRFRRHRGADARLHMSDKMRGNAHNKGKRLKAKPLETLETIG